MHKLPRQVSESLLRLVDAQRFTAHAVVDEDENLVRLGGHLEHYGLEDLRTGAAATLQLPFIEGMLPLVETPFLIRSLEMPSGRIADVHLFADGGLVWLVLLDTTAEHDEAQRIQQKAYDMTLLSEREARLIAQLEAANTELERAHSELAASREKLQAAHNQLRKELNDAARYVRACLPEPLETPVAVDWLYEPTAELGGDSFGYLWLDDEHFAIYLLDVCGHGIGAALLSVAANQTLRSQALPGVNFDDPSEVLNALNDVYQMDQHDDLFFTVWYGVYHRTSGALCFASAGHAPPILIEGPHHSAGVVRALEARGPILGLSLGAKYIGSQTVVNSPARLYLFSDGVFEISRPDGSMLDYETFANLLLHPPENGGSELDALLQFAQSIHGHETLEDDFSIVRLKL